MVADGGQRSRQRKILEFMPKQEVGRTFHSKEGLSFQNHSACYVKNGSILAL